MDEYEPLTAGAPFVTQLLEHAAADETIGVVMSVGLSHDDIGGSGAHYGGGRCTIQGSRVPVIGGSIAHYSGVGCSL